MAASFHNDVVTDPPSLPNVNSANICLSCLEVKLPNISTANIFSHIIYIIIIIIIIIILSAPCATAH